MDDLIVDFNELVALIENAKQNALRKVNEELIMLYYNVGKYLSNSMVNTSWGDAYIDDVVAYVSDKCPNIKGFNRRGRERVEQFYETYRDDNFVSSLLTQICWTNHLMIMSKSKSVEERGFYISLCIKERYSSRELERQLESAYFERYMLSQHKLAPVPVQKHIQSRFLDTYVLEFLDLPEKYSEYDFKKAIIQNLKNFILEIGKDFSFVNEEYRVQVGGEDYYIDLLFYHRGLSCLVAFELKIGKFKPEHLGKINFYLEALDREHKKENENPSVGIILCANKDDEIVEYALSRSLSPTMISDYTLKLPHKELLQQKLHEFAALAELDESAYETQSQ